jgi:predicted metal-dependent enzyme (double-stranded beta helix superfamily)
MTRQPYYLPAFVRDLDVLVAQYADDYYTLVHRGQSLLERLITDTSWLRFGGAPASSGWRRQLLHRDPHGAYSVWAMAFQPGRTTPVHDHNTWGLIGVHRGEESEERFVRVDPQERDDHARLRPLGSTVNLPGSVTALVAPDEDLHRIRNMGETTADSIHIYGRPLNGRRSRVYDLETGAVTAWDTDPLGSARAWGLRVAGTPLRVLVDAGDASARELVEELRRRLLDAQGVSRTSERTS